MFYSHLAYTSADTGKFVPSDDCTVTRAVEITRKDGTFNNKYKPEPVVITCWSCCEELHECRYYEDKRLTSKWYNAARRTKGTAFAWRPVQSR